METTRRYFILNFVFSVLAGLSVWILQRHEGSKITTTEYVDFGLFLICLGSLCAFFIIFPLIILPVTWVLKKYADTLLVKIIVFLPLGAVLGVFVFQFLFEGFIKEYGLHKEAAAFIFTAAAAVYVLIEHFIVNVQSE